MSQEKTLQNLKELGFSNIEAQIYLLLGKKGPQRAKDIVATLKVNRQRLYEILKGLEKKGIIDFTLEHPAKFAAEPFEKVIDLFIKSKNIEAKRLEENKLAFLTDWKSIAIPEIDKEIPEKFAIIESRKNVYSKIIQMTEETQDQLLVNLPFEELIRAYQNNVLDIAFKSVSKTKPVFRFLTESSNQNATALRTFLRQKPKTPQSFKYRILDSGLKLTSPMIIRDKCEALLFIDHSDSRKITEQVNTCLWTNCKSIVDSFSSIFEDSWQNSTEIDKKIIEMKTGKPTFKTAVIKDIEINKSNFKKALDSASKEVFIITSAKGLIDNYKAGLISKDSAKKIGSVRILAPITKENLDVAREFSEYCAIKHLPSNFQETIIIDETYLFQFNTSDSTEIQFSNRFEEAIYSNDPEKVKRTKNMLENIWQNARTPPIVRLDPHVETHFQDFVSDDEYLFSKPHFSEAKSYSFIEEKPDLLKENELLEKIFNGKKHPVKNWPKNELTFYGSAMAGIIFPPISFNLPKLLISARNWNKQSSMGAEELIVICMWLKTEKGFGFVPVVNLTSSPIGINVRKEIYKGTPAADNILLVKKDDVQVRIHGRNAFACWSIPIPLSLQYVLPPACITIEGYSRLKTVVSYYQTLSGSKTTFEGNGYEAFVTFYHPLSKYEGPGTDATLARDALMTVYPPRSNKQQIVK